MIIPSEDSRRRTNKIPWSSVFSPRGVLTQELEIGALETPGIDFECGLGVSEPRITPAEKDHQAAVVSNLDPSTSKHSRCPSHINMYLSPSKLFHLADVILAGPPRTNWSPRRLSLALRCTIHCRDGHILTSFPSSHSTLCSP